MAAYPAGQALNVQEAYDALEDYGKTFGRVPLLLLLHAAVPQSFRADMLNLMKLNFLAHEAGADLTVDVDVLFSPLVESAAAGYYRMDPEVRRHSLALLDAAYRHEPERRTVEMAQFVLAYADGLERRSGLTVDPLLAEYLAIQRWVALAFIDPAKTAEEFARALENAATDWTAGVRARLGAMTAALAIPLEGHEQLLAYARGLDAIARGDESLAERLFNGLGPEIRVGGVVLQPRRRLAERREPTGNTAPSLKAFVICSIVNEKEADRIAASLEAAGLRVYLARDDRIRRPTLESMRAYIGEGAPAMVILSRDSLDGGFLSLLTAARDGALFSPRESIVIALVDNEMTVTDLPGFMQDLPVVAAPAGSLPDGFAASLKNRPIPGDRFAPTRPTLLPRYARAAVARIFDSPTESVLLIHGGPTTAIEDVLGLLADYCDTRHFLRVTVDFDDYSGWRTPADVVRLIASQAGVDISALPASLAEQTESRHILQLADWLAFALRDRRTLIVLKGFDTVMMPWQTSDLIRELLLNSLRKSPMKFVLLNFSGNLPAGLEAHVRRLALEPVDREDVMDYLRAVFEQRGQQVTPDVLETATAEIWRFVPGTGSYRADDIRRALQAAERLLFEQS